MTLHDPVHLARAVRSIHALFTHTPEWTESRLVQETQLRRAVVREALATLVSEHHVLQTYTTAFGQSLFVRAPAQEVQVSSDTPLSVQDLRVLQALRQRSDSASHLARQLNLTPTAINQSLQTLNSRGLVSIRYVGMLAIYQTTQGWGLEHASSHQS